MGGGAVGNFFLTRWVPETFLAQFNSGWQGYLVAGGVGLGGAFLLPELAQLAGGDKRRARMGAWIGLILELGARAYEDFQTQSAGTGTGYYTDDKYPVTKLAPGKGPIPRFPGQLRRNGVAALPPAAAANVAAAAAAATQAMGKTAQGGAQFAAGPGWRGSRRTA